MFDSTLFEQQNDITGPEYQQMLANVEREFGYMKAERYHDITGLGDFMKLQELTQAFYRSAFPDIHRDYVPLYHAIWKMRLKDVARLDNIHQDGGVHYFSKNGYQSRMLTIWTNIYKDKIDGLSDSDMGIYVIDNKDPANQPLYEKMAAANTHFSSKKKGELSDCMYIAGPVIKHDTDQLKRTNFDFDAGVSIGFNSHLLHGSVPCHNDLSAFGMADLNKFRVSLSTVWLHKDDLNSALLDMPEAEHEKIYLSKLDPSMWGEVKTYFREACAAENIRLIQMKRLIRDHLLGQ